MVSETRIYELLFRLDKKWMSDKPIFGIRTKFDRFWTINWPNINILNDETNFI